MKKCLPFGLITVLLGLFTGQLRSQGTLSLREAYQLTEQNYPLLKNLDVYQAIKEKEDDLIRHSRKPMIRLRADASLQSESINIGSDLPNSPISIDVPIYRAQGYGEISYDLYDGGMVNMRQQINEIQALIRRQEIRVSIYALRQQVNQLHSGIILGENLIKLFDLTVADLNARIEMLRTGVKLGTVLESEVTKLEVRLMEVQNEVSKIRSDILSARATLSVLTGRNLTQDTELVIDVDLEGAMNQPSARPEYTLFEQQRLAVKAQQEMVDVADKPSIQVFGQAGMAYPNALNFAKVELAPFALTGIRFAYKIFDKSDKSMQQQKLELQKLAIDNEEATFRHNLRIQQARYAEELNGLQDQATRHADIAKKQAIILTQLQAQLDNGVITATEYLIQSNAELAARQNLEITKVKIKQKQLEFITLKGYPDGNQYNSK